MQPEIPSRLGHGIPLLGDQLHRLLFELVTVSTSFTI